MKFKNLFFSIIAAGFLSSAVPVDKSPIVGRTAPKIETIDGTNVVGDANPAGKTHVISFWSPKKPASRIANQKLSRIYGNDSKDNVEFISICTDSDEKLMNEVMKIDGVKADKVYTSDQLSSRVMKDYGADKSPRAFKISPDGKIVEVI